MAKLKAPLFSLGASGQIGKALVYFPWKGLNVVREHVIPSNPKTSGQNTQRGYMATVVAAIHAYQALAANPLSPADIQAYSLWASVVQPATTWFNQMVKNLVNQLVAGLSAEAVTDGTSTPGAGQLLLSVFDTDGNMTTGDFWYGTSKTALIYSESATLLTGEFTATPTGLTAGLKYFWQFRPTAPASSIGANSGIYYGVPT